MTSLSCENCGKTFTRKSNYTAHINRKTPCKSTENNNGQIENNNYSELSHMLTKKLKKEIKKDNGIYFTPPTTVNRCIEILKPYMETVQYILEPSCGSCEFILALNREYPSKYITGIEYNETIYDAIKYLNEMNGQSIDIKHLDFLKFETERKYDLIIGNPPYFVMSKKDVNKKYYDYFEGRPNIFILFIVKSLSMLNDNGILSFVLPKSFMNCVYYDKTRKFIAGYFKIIDIVECKDRYIETDQETILLIVQKNENIQENSEFIISINDYTIFGIKGSVKKIRDLYIGSTNLNEIGFKVSVGNVVWNQCKDILTDDPAKTRLIYSSDIKNNELILKKYSNNEKKNFIDKQGITYPTLVINRGYGVGEYNFEYCLIEGGFEYLIENHLICINYIGESQTNITNKQLIYLYKKIMESLEDERTKKFIELYFGNNAINTTELNYVLPIYFNQ